MGRGRRKGFPGVEVAGVDGAKFQVAYDIAYGCVGCGSGRYVVTEG